MAKGGGGKVKDTADQKERASIGLAQEARWEDKFKPLEDELIANVRNPEPERRMALGDAASATTQQFGALKPKVEAGLTNSGAGLGSGRFNLAVSGMGIDEGTSRGAGAVNTNNAIDDNYYAGLNSLAQMGRGQQADAINGLSDLASMSGRQAANDAALAAGNRAAWQGAAGTAAGIGGYGLSKYANGFGSGPGTGNEGTHMIYNSEGAGQDGQLYRPGGN